jgi:hypothetical protein
LGWFKSDKCIGFGHTAAITKEGGNRPVWRGVNTGMKTFWQKLEGTTDQVLAEIGRLIDAGNIRRVVVKQRGRTVAEFPVTVGVIGAVIAPLAAAIGAIAAVLAECTIEVEKTVPDETESPVVTVLAPSPTSGDESGRRPS